MKNVFALAVLCGLTTVVFAQTGRFSADDLPGLVRISDPQIAPDGKTIALIASRSNLKEDRWETELNLVDVATRQMRPMTHGRLGVAWVRWSPDGSRLAFLAQDAEKKVQVWVLPVGGGEALQVTHSKTPVRQLAWRPDGAALAFAAPDDVAEKKDEAKFEDAFEVGNNSYLERAAAVPVHLWTVDLPASGANPEPKRLTSGAWSLPVHAAPSGPPPEIAYTPDGKQMLFVRAESPITGESESSRLELLDIASGAMHPLTGSGMEEDGPRLSPDGSMVAYSYPRDGKKRNEESVYVVALHGDPGKGVGRNATEGLDRAVGSVAWLPDGKTLLVSGPNATKVGLWLQPLGGTAKPIDIGDLVPAAATVGRHGEIAFVATDANHAPELFYKRDVNAAVAQLTHVQTALQGITLGAQETLTWKSSEWTVDGVLTYPPGYPPGPGKKLPLVLYLHGGPTATSLQTFTPSSQILAAQGWLVFEPNYRGSNNLGNAFESAIVNDASAGPGRDILAGVEALKARGIVDETRIAVSGWSYGGQMTAWMIGNYPEVWKAAVAGAPVTDLVDQYTLSDNNVERAAGYGPSPFVGDNLGKYAQQSPLTFLWKAKAPTLIMSDVGDWRVTTTQAYKLYHALKDNGVPVKFVAFPVPGHSPADPIRSRDVWRRWVAWLKVYLGPDAS